MTKRLTLLLALVLLAGCEQEPTPRPSIAPVSAPIASVSPSLTSAECADQAQVVAVDPPEEPPNGLIEVPDMLTRGLTWTETWINTGDGDRGNLPTTDDMPRLVIPEGTAMALRLTGDVAFIEYRAGVVITDRWPHRANDGNRMLRSGEATDAAYIVVCLPSPPPGDWVMNARLVYDLGRGHGDFYWRLVVQ